MILSVSVTYPWDAVGDDNGHDGDALLCVPLGVTSNRDKKDFGHNTLWFGVQTHTHYTHRQIDRYMYLYFESSSVLKVNLFFLFSWS